MSFFRLLLRRSLPSLRPISSTTTTTTTNIPLRSFAFSSAEEAAAERRRRKRRLRIEPPLHALRPQSPQQRPPRDPNAPRLPDSTSALVGDRLSLHNSVQSLIRAGELDAASKMARGAVFSRPRPTVFTCNAVMASMMRAGRLEDAVALFSYFFNQGNIVPNVVSYNILINTHCNAGRVNVGLDIYHHILENAPFSPSPVTYRHLTKGLVDADRIQDAMDLLREMLNRGHGADSLVYRILIQAFIDKNNMEKAYEIFDELKERCMVYDGVVHIPFMEQYWKQGKDKEAMDNYQLLLDREFKMSPQTCHELLITLFKHDKDKEADKLFQHMLDTHNHPASVAVTTETYNIMVNRKFELGKFNEAIETFHRTGLKPVIMDVGCFNNIIGKLCQNGLTSEAEKLFEGMSKRSVPPNATTYEFLVDGLFGSSRVDEAMKYFMRMLDVGEEGYSGVKVDLKFYCKMFDGLVKAQYVSQAMDVFWKMKEKKNVRMLKLDPVSYETFASGLCKIGSMDQGWDLLVEMVRSGVPTSTQFREFVTNSFRESGRLADVEQLFMGGSQH